MLHASYTLKKQKCALTRPSNLNSEVEYPSKFTEKEVFQKLPITPNFADKSQFFILPDFCLKIPIFHFV